jgi:GTP-binding protein EngB required for normal cell division
MRLEENHPLMYRRRRRAEQLAERDRAAVGIDVAERLTALDVVITAGAGRLTDEQLAPARELHHRAGQRLRMSGSHTVVALAGATGSGKSSLFNALSGVPMSAVGVRRPTTGVAHAVIWGVEGAGPLLDWLQIPRRHYLDFLDGRTEGDHRLDGLVLLDLPDHDSTTVAHRLEVDRLVGMVDVLVWVLDPQKYADAAVHERYLRPLAGHAAVMVVVLNQADRLPAHQVDAALADVRRLLAADGLGPVPVLATSAVAPDGLNGLREVLIEAVAAHVAALRRVAADLDAVSAGLGGVVAGPARQSLDRTAVAELTAALSSAAGVSTVGTAVRQAYLHRAARTMGSPFLRWLRRLRPDPLRRLHLDRRPDPGRSDADRSGEDLAATRRSDTVSARSSVPEPSAVQRSRVDQALRRLADHASEDLAAPWPDALRAAARSRSADLTDRLDRAVTDTDLGVTTKPAWWRALGAAQALLAATAIAGGLWLAGLYGLTVLRLPEPSTPMVGAVPLPTVLLLGGLLLGLLLALLARLLALLFAGRRAARAEARMRTAVAEVADELVLAPVRAELSAYDTLRTALAQLRPSR